MIIDEPGDKTRYEHLVADDGDYVLIGSLSGLYSGYRLRKDSVCDFMSRYPKLSGENYMNYQGEVTKYNALADHYVGYVASHCGFHGKDCNPWTALSIIRAAHELIMQVMTEEQGDEEDLNE